MLNELKDKDSIIKQQKVVINKQEDEQAGRGWTDPCQPGEDQ